MKEKKISEFTGKYRFLSNFYPCHIEFEGIRYPSVENAYQAAKTLDYEDREMFITCTAGQAKKWGSPTGRIKIQDGWEKKKLGIMEYLVKKKFNEYPFRLALFSTGTAILEEGNWWGDEFWGKVDGIGKNHLGFILMKVREELRNEEILGSKGSEEKVTGSFHKVASSKSNPEQKKERTKAQKLGKKELARRVGYASMH